jgi:DNA-directed RNA polymerase III subunit RPC8
MYILVELKDVVRIAPNQFDLPLDEAIAEELNAKLANRVIVNVGLCIALYDIIKINQSFVYQGDGASHTEVNFRFVVFRPFVGEVIVGKLRSCTREGVHVSLGFFEDIIIPSSCLQEPNRFDEKEQLWVWEYESEEKTHSLFMDIGEKVRFKVKEEMFTDTSPPGPSPATGSGGAPVSSGTPLLGPGFSGASGDGTNAETQRKVPYLIKGTAAESGLGMISWWK